MNKELENLVMGIYKELLKIHLIKVQFKQLYKDAETVSILNKTAKDFFYLVQEQFFDSILLGISKLTDRDKSQGNDNLSINSIKNYIENEELRNEIILLCEKAVSASAFARDHRNKRIAHADLNLYLDKKSTILENASFDKIEKSYEEIEKVIKFVFSRVFRRAVMEPVLSLSGSANKLVEELKKLEK